jgi:hypothetical protein
LQYVTNSLKPFTIISEENTRWIHGVDNYARVFKNATRTSLVSFQFPKNDFAKMEVPPQISGFANCRDFNRKTSGRQKAQKGGLKILQKTFASKIDQRE